MEKLADLIYDPSNDISICINSNTQDVNINQFSAALSGSEYNNAS